MKIISLTLLLAPSDRLTVTTRSLMLQPNVYALAVGDAFVAAKKSDPLCISHMLASDAITSA